MQGQCLTFSHSTDQGQIPDTTQHSDNSPAHWVGYSHTWNTVQSFVVKVSMMFFRMKLMMLIMNMYQVPYEGHTFTDCGYIVHSRCPVSMLHISYLASLYLSEYLIFALLKE